ncbi:MAG: ribosome maturation factor RimM [Acidobacteriaceae bacterium]
MTDLESSENWVHLARLIRPQGRRGELIAEILTDFPERFADMRNAFLWRGDGIPPAAITIEQSWLHKGKVVLKFAGVDTISAAEAMRGAEVVVPAAERMPLGLESVYISDLIGCEVLDTSGEDDRDGRAVGKIRDVIQQNETTDLLIVRSKDGREHEIPFAKAYLARIDLEGRRVEMKLPAGLLEVNAPLSEDERRTRSEESESQP